MVNVKYNRKVSGKKKDYADLVWLSYFTGMTLVISLIGFIAVIDLIIAKAYTSLILIIIFDSFFGYMTYKNTKYIQRRLQ